MESAFSGCVPSDLGTAGTGTADQQQGGYRPAPRGTWERLRSPPSACFRNNSRAGVAGRRTWSSSTSWSQNECSGAQTEPWLAHPMLGGPGQGRLCPAPHGGPGNQAEPPLGKGGASFFPRPSASWLSAINMGKRSCQISLFLNFLGLSSNKPSQGLLPDRRNGHCPDTHCVLAPTRPFTKLSCFTSATAPSVDLHLVCP